MADLALPTFEDVAAAAKRIEGLAVRTPLIESTILNDRVQARVLIKPENQQRTGAFKFRGAYNLISQIDRADWPGGVTTCSSGNHAQGVAEAARLCGLPAAIVMPADAPALKLARTRRSGADVVAYDRNSEDREAIAARLGEERRAIFVPPYNSPDIIAGQGTLGRELMEDARALDAEPDAVLAPCGGGGLISGVALAVKHAREATEVYAVEPEGFDDHARSLASGRRETNEALSGTICDALMAPTPGELTFAINSRLLSGALAVCDTEVRRAVRFAFEELKLVLEPGGAVALAALLAGRFDGAGKTVAIILSGGNIDRALFAEILEDAD
jgi:threonine dehydratase